MLLGCIADDFTGASDIANTLARQAMATTQFIGVPNHDAGERCDAGVIALKIRSIDAEEAVNQALRALRWLKDQGCRQIIFKYCSTFDSTPKGNIGPVAEALAIALDAKQVVVCPAFPETGRTVYQGNLFVHDRPLAESGMEKHPINPMTDSDIRRWLRLQTRGSVGHIAFAVVRSGSAKIRQALRDPRLADIRLVVVDALSEIDLVEIGQAVSDAPLVTGASGIALGLPRNFIRMKLLTPSQFVFGGVSGPAVALAGSCSSATREQVNLHKRKHPSLAIRPREVMLEQVSARTIAEFLMGNASDLPLAYSSDTPENVASTQRELGQDAVSRRLDRLFGEVASLLVQGGIARLIVAGGETSGAVVSALGITSLQVGPEIDPGVPALKTEGNHSIGLALKSGNFGAPDFFEKAARILEARP